MADSSSVYEGLHPTKRKFLAAFEECGSLIRASRWAKISRQNHWKWMHEDPLYPAAFAEAERRSVWSLKDEAVRRAREGLRRAKWHKGKIVGYETEFSDTLLIQMLKARAPEEFRERIDQRLTGKDGESLIPAATADAIIKLASDAREVEES